MKTIIYDVEILRAIPSGDTRIPGIAYCKDTGKISQDQYHQVEDYYDNE